MLSVGSVSLTDANGITCLMVQADSPLLWPQYFGVLAAPNAANPANFDLNVVFDPQPGGPAGVTGPVHLEQFTNLTLMPGTANYAVTQLNSLSKFISVPSSYTPPAANPTTFPSAPTMLLNTGTVELEDASPSRTPYLTLQPSNPLSWPPLFGVLAQGELQTPTLFSLLLLYQPPSGGVGVTLPIVVEQFNGVSLATVANTFAAGSDLISVRSFEQEPNPSLSAYDLMHYDANANQGGPTMTLTGTLNGVDTTWTPAPDLLAAGATDTNFVVEIESDGTAHLRFGDDTNGMLPLSGTSFIASYRVGNGTAGNVGSESLVFLAGDPRIQSCTNPLPASGGFDPETSDQIRRRAPQAFLTQERAITMSDYATVTEANSQVEDAAAMLRWTGSWYTVFITAEPQCGGNLSRSLRRTLTQYVNRYRLAGQA